MVHRLGDKTTKFYAIKNPGTGQWLAGTIWDREDGQGPQLWNVRWRKDIASLGRSRRRADEILPLLEGHWIREIQYRETEIARFQQSVLANRSADEVRWAEDNIDRCRETIAECQLNIRDIPTLRVMLITTESTTTAVPA